MQGILTAIEEEIDSDIDAISEILGRTRLVLADQHDSHLPPTGEIGTVPDVLETPVELHPVDDGIPPGEVIIIGEEASVVEGSNSSSAIYGLFERLQILPRVERPTDDLSARKASQRTPSVYTTSCPAALPVSHSGETLGASNKIIKPPRAARSLLQSGSNVNPLILTARAQVSGTHASPEPHQVSLSPLPTLSGHGLHAKTSIQSGGEPLESLQGPHTPRTVREKLHSILTGSGGAGFSAWLYKRELKQGIEARDAAQCLQDVLTRDPG